MSAASPGSAPGPPAVSVYISAPPACAWGLRRCVSWPSRCRVRAQGAAPGLAAAHGEARGARHNDGRDGHVGGARPELPRHGAQAGPGHRHILPAGARGVLCAADGEERGKVHHRARLNSHLGRCRRQTRRAGPAQGQAASCKNHHLLIRPPSTSLLHSAAGLAAAPHSCSSKVKPARRSRPTSGMPSADAAVRTPPCCRPARFTSSSCARSPAPCWAQKQQPMV